MLHWPPTRRALMLRLLQLIMELDEEDERKEDLLARLNAAVAKLTFTPQLPVQQRKENIW